MKIPATTIARFLRPARCSPVILAGRLSPETASRIVATVASTPDLVSQETYLLAVAILAREIVCPAARHERQVAREVRRTRERWVMDRVRARVLANSSGSVERARVTWIETATDLMPRRVGGDALD